ncbi:MAG: glycosyltransferase [Ignavibacteriaceae bacterium]|nr:glycosyltransferase [Ignavibacteriaceae bacterium]
MISIIIPALNEEEFLPNLLRVLKNQTYKDFEVIVADANSTDKTAEIAKLSGAKVVKGGIQSVGRNNGFKASIGEIILFLDADITFNPDFLEKSLSEFSKRKLDVACSMFSIDSKLISQNMHNIATNTSFKLREKTPLAMATGATLFFNRRAFEKIGGFNEKMRITEDQEIIRKAKKLKLKFGVLKTTFSHSERRYLNNGIIKMLVGGFLGMMVLGSAGIVFKKQLEKHAEKYYGEWGNWKKKTNSF